MLIFYKFKNKQFNRVSERAVNGVWRDDGGGRGANPLEKKMLNDDNGTGIGIFEFRFVYAFGQTCDCVRVVFPRVFFEHLIKNVNNMQIALLNSRYTQVEKKIYIF